MPYTHLDSPPKTKILSKPYAEIEDVADHVEIIANTYFNYDFTKSEIHVNDGTFIPKTMRMFAQTLFQEELKLALFRNARNHREQISLSDDTIVDLYCIKKYNATNLIFPMPSLVRKRPRPVDVAVVIPHHVQEWFGHFITDDVCLMMYIPQWVLAKNPVISFTHPSGKAWIDIAKAALPEKYRNVEFHNGDFPIAAREMYVLVQSSIVHGCSISKLAPKLKDYFQTSKITPMYYGFFNKNMRTRRYFHNLKDFIKELEPKYGNFKEFQVNQPTYQEFYKGMASLKVLICPCGSIAFNSIFMQPGSGLFMLSGEVLDLPEGKMALELGFWSMQIIHKNIKHSEAGMIDIDRAKHAFDFLMTAMKQGKWPSLPKEYKYDFDIPAIKAKLEEAPYKWQCNLGTV